MPTRQHQPQGNQRVIDAIVAAARARSRTPEFSWPIAKQLAEQIDHVMLGTRGAECTVALCIQLLRTLGVADPGDQSRLTDG